MLNDRSFEDRLNAVKQGNPVPEPPMQPRSMITNNNNNNNNNNNPIQPPKNVLIPLLITKVISLVDTLLASFLYGVAINTVFNLEWTLLGSLAVGFFLNHAIAVFPRLLFPKRFNK